MLTLTPPTASPRSAAEIVSALRRGGTALVALSGGVDSAVVAALASEALGPEVTAVTLVGPAVGRSELARATTVARFLEIPHVLVPVDPLAREEYRANPSNRCYFCRSTESQALTEWGTAHRVRQYLDGVHLDDLSDDRPGLRAMTEAGFRHPLLSAGWTKASVREHARSIGLPNWDAPSDACLASRVPHGRPIDREILGRIERAEELVRARGFRRVRVRVVGDGARVVVDSEEVDRLLGADIGPAVRAELEALGFRPVELDPQGYRRRANS